MNLTSFLANVQRYWKTFVVTAGSVFVLGLAWLLLTPITYTSTAQLMVSVSGSTTAAAYENDNVVAGRVNSYITLLSSDIVSKRVIAKLNVPLTVSELAGEISATNVPPKTSIIDLAVTDRSRERARLLTDTVATEFVNYTRALETATGEDGQKVHTTVITTATEPRAHYRARVLVGVLVALAAVLLGAVAVWIRSLTDPLVRTAERAAEAAGAPVLGSVAAIPVTSIDDLDGYRCVRTGLQSIAGTGAGIVVEVASPGGEVDATMIASNLGRAMEFAGNRSIVIDGGTDASEQARPELQRTPDGYPDIVPLHGWSAETDLTAVNTAAELIDRLRGDYPRVIIAAPAVLSSRVASTLSDYADAVLLLVTPAITKRHNLSRAADSLRATGAHVVGVVLVDDTTDAVNPKDAVDASESPQPEVLTTEAPGPRQ